jgi:hypothetical protein
LKRERLSHPHHKELGGGESKEQEDFESPRGDPTSPTPWRALHLLFAALGMD